MFIDLDVIQLFQLPFLDEETGLGQGQGHMQPEVSPGVPGPLVHALSLLLARIGNCAIGRHPTGLFQEINRENQG